MTISNQYLPGAHDRARHMRLDVARILKRFFFCERPLIIAQAGWLPSLAQFEAKVTQPKILWEDALTADALRTRVFELRYPSRLLEIGDDKPIVEVFEQASHAPNALAFLRSLAEVFKPTQLMAYQQYLDVADTIADGPSIRFLKLAIQEKQAQIRILTDLARETAPGTDANTAAEADAWVRGLKTRITAVGGLDVEPATDPGTPLNIPARREFTVADVPARDKRFQNCHYYWPNVIDPDFSYGEGMLLQLRSAVSHLNEVWAVETGGAILHAFADKLDWEFVLDAARWTYDEARHTRMGYERLRGWGFDPSELPLGTHIYDSARGQDPIVRLGMLHYFETKNIGKKNERAEAFSHYQDDVSQHDMEFDWADETIHAHYGSKWLNELHKKYPELPDREALHAICDRLVAQEVADATPADRARIRSIADAMINKAKLKLE